MTTPEELREAVARAMAAYDAGEGVATHWQNYTSYADIALAVIGKACAEVARKGVRVPHYTQTGQESPVTVVSRHHDDIAAAILTLTGARDDG